MNIQFMVGCDPEVFVTDALTGQPVTAHGLIPGDKKEPFKVPGGAIQVDGMALEFNTDPVDLNAEGFDVFNARVLQVLGGLKKQLGTKHKILYDASVVFDPEYYETAVPDDAKELGCDPDFNAYRGGEQNPAPDSATTLRGAAGHIHIGWGSDIPHDHPDHIAICCDFIKAMDAYVGLAMVCIEDEKGAARKQAYGKAGAFRPKSYGVEYRTPSNAWISSESRRAMIWTQLAAAITDMQRNKPNFVLMREAYGFDYEAIINNDTSKPWQKQTAVYGIKQDREGDNRRMAAHILCNIIGSTYDPLIAKWAK